MGIKDFDAKKSPYKTKFYHSDLNNRFRQPYSNKKSEIRSTP